jgi:rSAM-associated Gly-rich repeat protein
MSLSSRSSLLGFLLALPAIGLPASNAALNPSPDPAVPLEATTEIERATPPLSSVEARLQRLAAVIRSQEKDLAPGDRPGDDMLTAAVWGNGGGNGAFVNGHPYYGRPGFLNGGGGWRNGGYFGNGGGWRNGGAAWRNGGGGGAWRNGGGGGFRNW